MKFRELQGELDALVGPGRRTEEKERGALFSGKLLGGWSGRGPMQK